MTYIHGYSDRETQRLYEQSDILEDLLHSGVQYSTGTILLEAGCGVGAQTRILSRRNPGITIHAVDISAESIAIADENNSELKNVRFSRADIQQLPFPDEHFDAVFVCFVLEHVKNPLTALLELKRVLKKGGSITIIEGDHASCVWQPCSDESLVTWQAMIKAQELLGHDPNIGRKLYPLMVEAGFMVSVVEPRTIYTDHNNQELQYKVSSQIIVPMTLTAEKKAISEKLIDKKTWDKGIEALKNIGTEANYTFYYSWLRGIGKK